MEYISPSFAQWLLSALDTDALSVSTRIAEALHDVVVRVSVSKLDGLIQLRLDKGTGLPVTPSEVLDWGLRIDQAVPAAGPLRFLELNSFAVIFVFPADGADMDGYGCTMKTLQAAWQPGQDA